MKKVCIIALTSILMSVCISCNQKTMNSENGLEVGNPETKAGSPQILGVTSKVDDKGSKIILDSLLSQYGIIKLPDKLNEGETLADYMLKQPGVQKDDNENIILVSGKKVTSEDMDFIEKLQNYK